MSALLAFVGGIIGTLLLLFAKLKKDSADAAADAEKKIQELKELEKSLVKNEVLLEQEEQKRAELQNSKSQDVSNEDLVDYFNKRDGDK